MKKIIALISAAVIALTLTGCNNTDDTSSGSDGSATVSSAAHDSSDVPAAPVSSDVPAAPESSDVPASSGDAESADVPAEPNSSDIPANPDNSVVVPDDPNNPGDPNEGVDNSGLAFPDNRAGRMVKAALGTSEWSYMDLMDETTLPYFFPDLKLEDCEEYCIAFCGMSAQLQYAISIKPKAGSESTVKTTLENFVQAKKDDQMLYPEQQVVAQKAVQGEDGGYLYVVFHENSQSVADAMTAAQ